MPFIDLHTHSSASDGTDSPAELVAKAKAKGLAAIALTDHDTLDGLDEALEAGLALGVRVIRGCEISTLTELGEMHILGLWLPRDSGKLEAMLRHFRAIRQERNRLMLAKLRALGLNISMEDVMAHAGGSMGRPHIARALVEKGYVKNMEDAFRNYLGASGAAYVPKRTPRPVPAVKILSGLGATVAMAHPLLQKWPLDWLAKMALELSSAGLDAVEAWHSSHEPEDTRWLVGLAGGLGLGLTGGSDYHGANKPRIDLGECGQNVRVPIQVLEDLIRARSAKGLPC